MGRGYLNLLTILTVLTLLGSCTSVSTTHTDKKKATINLKSSESVLKASADKLSTDYNQLKINSSLEVSMNGKKLKPRLNTYLEKDKSLWLNVSYFGFEVARAFISTSEFRGYEKMGKRYVDESLTDASELLGISVSVSDIQNILLGRLIKDVSLQNYSLSVEDFGYVLTPKIGDKSRVKKIVFDFDFFLQQVVYTDSKDENKQLLIKYSEWMKVAASEFYLPQSVVVNITNSKWGVLSIKNQGIKYNEKSNLLFRIPKGYKRLSL